MSVDLLIPNRRSRLTAELGAWARQMWVALHQPHPRDVISNHVEIARAVDRGVSNIRLRSLDPRL